MEEAVVTAASQRPGPRLRGTLTALLTPFRGGEIDYEVFGRQIDRQIEAGVDGLVPVGTTGESPTLSMDEHRRVISFVIERVARRIPVVPGTGANSTAEAVELSKFAVDAGADAGLVVVPYYNRPMQHGIVDHYRRVWDESGLPLVVYNIPSRTGTGLTADTYDRLAGIHGVIAVKEASGDLGLASHLLSSHDLVVLAGDDALAVPMMSIGAAGVISVASNILPFEMKAMTNAALKDEWSEARRIHRALFRCFRALFNETNPIPVKCAMHLLGHDSGELRAPLTAAQSNTETTLRGELQALGLLGEDLDLYIDPRD